MEQCHESVQLIFQGERLNFGKHRVHPRATSLKFKMIQNYVSLKTNRLDRPQRNNTEHTCDYY